MSRPRTWSVLAFGLSSGPEMSAIVATSLRRWFLRTLAAAPTVRSYTFSGLHPGPDPPVLGPHLRVQREDARHDVELAVGAQYVVHGPQISVHHLGIEVKVRTVELRSKRSGDRRVAGVHEAAGELHRGRAGESEQPLHRGHQVGPRDEHLVGGGRAFVHPAELPVGDL